MLATGLQQNGGAVKRELSGVSSPQRAALELNTGASSVSEQQRCSPHWLCNDKPNKSWVVIFTRVILMISELLTT